MNENRDIVLVFESINSSFEQNEVVELSKRFRHVFVIVEEKNNSFKLPSNAEYAKIDSQNLNKPFLFKKNFFFIFQIIITDILIKFNWIYLFQWRTLLNEALNCLSKAQKIEGFIQEKNLSKDAIFLSFWLNNYATALAILKKRGVALNAFSRAHGRDLYEWRQPKTGRLPFKYFQLKNLSAVFPISKTGETYLKNRYPAFANKITCFYLGSYENGLNPFPPEEPLTIVSCAVIRNVKRIHLIGETILKLNIPVTWYHIGEESDSSEDKSLPLYHAVKDQLLKNQDIKYHALGKKSNEEVMRFYRETPVHLFMSLSETEGLPISMMEAQSFGIPILSTDVGGCSEIVNTKTGVLVGEEEELLSIAQKIIDFKKLFLNSEQGRLIIKKHWDDYFNITKNYHDFVNKLTT